MPHAGQVSFVEVDDLRRLGDPKEKSIWSAPDRALCPFKTYGDNFLQCKAYLANGRSLAIDGDDRLGVGVLKSVDEDDLVLDVVGVPDDQPICNWLWRAFSGRPRTILACASASLKVPGSSRSAATPAASTGRSCGIRPSRSGLSRPSTTRSRSDRPIQPFAQIGDAGHVAAAVDFSSGNGCRVGTRPGRNARSRHMVLALGTVQDPSPGYLQDRPPALEPFPQLRRDPADLPHCGHVGDRESRRRREASRRRRRQPHWANRRPPGDAAAWLGEGVRPMRVIVAGLGRRRQPEADRGGGPGQPHG